MGELEDWHPNYDDVDVSMRSETFDKDFDDVGFEPLEVDDSDDEAAEVFDY